MNFKKLSLKYFIIFIFVNIFLVTLSGLFLFNHIFKEDTTFYVNEKIKTVDFIIHKEASLLKKLSVDWGEWDDAYNFVNDKNKEFINNNFGGNTTLIDLGIKEIIFLDKNLNLVYGRIVDKNKEKEIKKLPPFDYSKNGFNIYFLNHKLYLVYIHDITNTKKNKKNGKIVVFKYLNKKCFEKNGFQILKITCKHYNTLYKIKENSLIIYYPLDKEITLKIAVDFSKVVHLINEFFLHFILLIIITYIILFVLGIYFVNKITEDIEFIFNILSKGIKDSKALEALKNYKFNISEFELINTLFEKLYEKLYDFEQIYNILDQDAPFGVLIYNKNILYGNKFFLNLFSLNKEELKNLDPLVFFKDKSLKEKIAEINRKILNGEKIIFKYSTEIFYKNKNIYVFMVSFPVIYNNNKAIMTFAIDLTKQMEYQEIINRILNSIPVIVFEHSKNGENNITISENIEKILGFKVNEIDENWWVLHLHPKDKERILNEQDELKIKGKLNHIYRLRKKDGSYIWVNEYVFYKKENKEKIYGLVEDLTEEEIIKKLNASLSEINQFLIKAGNKKSIIDYICKKMIESEVFKFAWIGKVKDNKVIPLKHFGEGKEYLDDLVIEISDGVLSKGPTGEVLYNSNIIGINSNTFTNEKISPWREKQIKSGFFSSIAVRLIDDLTINLYSEFTDFYTQEVLNIISSIRSSFMMACEKNKYIEKLQYLTFYDEITNLGNLNKFKKDFNEYHDKYILCMINIKDFTSINSNFGFEFGNKVLKKVAEELKKHLKKEDEVYRMYDDRFLLFFKTDIWNFDIIHNLTQRISDIFSEEGLLIDNNTIFLEINGSIISSKDIEKEKALEGLIYAYVFVKKVVNKCVIYQPWMYEEVKERIYLKELLFRAIREKLFDVYFQPIVDINSYKVVQFEALLRLKDKNKFVNMEKFINIANELQLVPEITKIVVEKVTKYLKTCKNVVVSVNISKIDMEEGFLEFFKDMVIVNELDFKNFSLEITERESIENTELTKNFVKELKKVGVKLEIDDFGVAYSNLKQTVSIDFDILKIDKSFVDKIYEEKIQIAIKSTIFLAKSFNAKTIAEGVETKEQLEILKELGVDYIQGYYFAKPMPFNKAVEYLKLHI